MVWYKTFLELHDLYTSAPVLIRADNITCIMVDPNCDDLCNDVVRIYCETDKSFIVEETYEIVRGLLGQIYGKKG